MRLTIIPEDGFVSIDGIHFSNLDLSFIASNIHAIQWYDTFGEIEYKNENGFIFQNVSIDNIDDYSLAIDKWNAAKLARETKIYESSKEYLISIMTLEEYKVYKNKELASIRYSHEIAGINLSGMTIETNRESQSLINGAWSYAQLNPSVLIDWKGSNGWIQIDATMINLIATAVAKHVQSCFSNEKLLSNLINNCNSKEDIDLLDLNAGWV